MPSKQLQKTILSLAGEFLVAGQLSLRGFVASLTLKNYPGVDVFVFDPATEKSVSAQVKTSTYSSYYVPEHVDQEKCAYIFVQVKGTSARYFVVPAAIVAAISKQERDHYLESRPHVRREQPRMISLEALGPFEDRWENVWSAPPTDVVVPFDEESALD